MKKITLIIVMICLASMKGFAQIPVTDAAAGGQLTALNTSAVKAAGDRASALAKAVATLQQLTALKKQYDKTVEMVEDISDYVKQSNQVINMKNYLTDITSEYSRGITYIYSDKNISAKDRAVFQSVYTKMVGQSLDDFEYGTKIITDGNLKMNDAERLTILSEVEAKMSKNKNMIRYFNSSIKRAVAQKTKGKNQEQFIKENKNSFNKIRD
ncbi:hypothetical protein K6T82_23715 [Flavobacterium sp. 17A]|uniref:Conjugal transfer protein TraI n=1 Tax=Flavobacterium potami TaxID=2872310 RepID=A0A9X1HFU3_9FLAO|nr:hypothetical protein [Flavobacterium potami]MBZ4037785.1 hypothetical protein [Flavobacterium potami]